MAKEQSKEGKLPLSEHAYLIISSLMGGPNHGYAIYKDVGAFTEGRIRMTEPTLYSTIKRLLDDGMIERAEDVGDVSDGRRKAYRVLGAGVTAAREMERIMDSAAKRVRQQAQGA